MLTTFDQRLAVARALARASADLADDPIDTDTPDSRQTPAAGTQQEFDVETSANRSL
jgi:hypothetical protein